MEITITSKQIATGIILARVLWESIAIIVVLLIGVTIKVVSKIRG